MFQSSPGFGAGRYILIGIPEALLGLFQSSPGFGAGRYAPNRRTWSPRLRVSILARLWGRALLLIVPVNTGTKEVSILARLWGRALQYNCKPIIQQRNFLLTRELVIWEVIFWHHDDHDQRNTINIQNIIHPANRLAIYRRLWFAHFKRSTIHRSRLP